MTLGDRALRDLKDWVSGPAPGDLLDGRYELRQRIGEGGMGVVYAAYDQVGARRVAVKIVRGGGDQDTARFEREVSSLEKVSHPAIVRCVAHGIQDGSRYLVMDHLEGCSLAERLRLGRLSVRDTVVLGRRLAEALGEVHRAGISHRDIKPSNIFLVGDDGAPQRAAVSAACLLDFGIARSHEATTLTARGALVGTPGYMAPERVRGVEISDPASDVFSLGCVLFECLLGRPPFTAETTYALLARVLLEMAPLVREERPEAPLGLEALVQQMLAKEPAERPEAAEVARALAELEGGLPAVAAMDRVELAPGIAEGDIIGGKYRIERKLGEGGMGFVVAARHLELGTRVAIKLLRSGDGDEGRFLREAQAASRIESDHVARVLDVGRSSDGRPFIVMEHLRGVDLARRLAESGRLSVPVAVEFLLQACEAIGEAHALGIVHRDIKPSNLFIVQRRDGTELLKVLDFGISKITQPLDESRASIALTATADSTVMGSIAYMSPEQIESTARADARSDIWSLGVVLFELVSGTRPFVGDNALAVAARIAGSPPRSVRDARADAPAELDVVLSKCLRRDPDERFTDVAALARALVPLARPADGAREAREAREARSEPSSVPPPSGVGSRMGSGSRTRSFVLAAGALGVLGVLGLFMLRSEERPVSRGTIVAADAERAPARSGEPPSVVPMAPASPAATTAAPAPSGSVIAKSAALPSQPMTPAADAAARAPSVSATTSARPPSIAASSGRVVPPAAPSSSPKKDLDLRDPALEGR